MKSILEKLTDASLNEDRRRVMKAVKRVAGKMGIKVKNLGGRIVFTDAEGNVIPAVSPINSGLAIQKGEAGHGAFYMPYGDDTKYGVKGTNAKDIISYFASVKKSVFESILDKYTDTVMEGKMDLSGQGKYGPDIDTDSFSYFVRASIKSGEKSVPLLIWGAPGIGKTAIVRSVVNEFGGKKRLIIKNLGQCQKDDFSLPRFAKDIDGEVIGAEEVPKTWLPMYKVTGDPVVDEIADNIANGGTKDGQVGEGGVIFFDEIARCSKDVQNVALSLIEDRELAGYRLGSKWCIIAASNRSVDDPNIDITLSKALGNRFMQCNFIPSFDAWKDWADSKKFMSPEVTNFLKFNQKYWYIMDPDDDDEHIFASPRSWTKCCELLASCAMGADEDGLDINNIPRMIIQKILTGTVGEDAATEFLTYWDLTKAIDVDALNKVFENPKGAPSLLKGKDGKAIRTDIKHYMVAKVLSQLDESKMPEVSQMTNLAKWLTTSKDESLVGSAIQTLFHMFPKLRLQIGDPASKDIHGNTDWDKYIEFVQILIEAMPGLDKDFEVDM